jgi:hypothetical protein
MRPLKALPKRAAEKARDTAAGSPTPAGQEPLPDSAAAHPGARERAAMRRRVRKVARARDELVRELGVLVAEMERLGRHNDDLVKRKARRIVALGEELEGLRGALGERLTLERVVAAGIAGSCSSCGSLLGTEDRFCSHCGTPAGARSGHTESSNGAHPQTDGAGAQRA